jgi:tetratricopeptide (TPR) repeat protein
MALEKLVIHIIRLFLFFNVFINFSLSLAASETTEKENWTLLTTIDQPSDQSLMVLVNGLSDEALIELDDDDSLNLIQNSPQNRGLGGAFFIEASDQPKRITLRLSRIYHTSIPLSAKAYIVPLGKGHADKENWIKFSKALNLWSNGGESNRRKSILLQRQAIKSTLLNSENGFLVLETFLNSLLALEESNELLEFGKNYFKNKSLIIKSNDYRYESVVLWAMAASYSQVEEFQKSHKYYQRLLNLLESENTLSITWQINLEEIRGSLGTMLVLSGMQNGKRKTLDQGRDFIQTAIMNSQKFGAVRLIAQLQNALAPYYAYIGDEDKSEEVLLASFAGHELAGESSRLADTLNNLSVLYRRQGRFNEALVVLNRALEIESEKPYRSERANLSLNLAGVYLRLGKYSLAEVSAVSARDQFTNAGNDYAAAQACVIQGNADRLAGNIHQAEEVHKECLSKFISIPNLAEIDQEDPYHDLAQIYLQLSKDSVALNDFDRAYDYGTQSFKSYFGGNTSKENRISLKNSLELEIILSLALSALMTNKEEEFGYYKNSLDYFFGSSETEEKFPLQKLMFKELMIEYFAIKGDIPEMENVANSMLQLGEEIRLNLGSKYLGSAWSARLSNTFERYVSEASNYAIKKDDRALLARLFIFLEKSSAVSFYESRGFDDTVRSLKGDAGANILIEKAQAEEWNAATATSSLDRNEALARVIEAREMYLGRYSRNNSHDTSVSNRKILSLPELMNVLKKEDLLIRVFTSPNYSFAYLINSDGWFVKKTLNEKSLKKSMLDIMKLVSSRSNKIIESKFNLDSIFGDFTRLVEQASKIIIVSNGAISSFPIGILNIAGNNDRYRPLDSVVSVVQAYSLSDYVEEISSIKSDFVNDIAVFADPIFDSGDQFNLSEKNDSIFKLRAWSSTLTRLPWTAKEAEHISHIFDDKDVLIVKHEEATTQRLMSSDMRDSRILHIASHGYFSELTPDIVGIATAPSINGDVGFVTLTRLMSERFKSNLVVISGCETSLGEDLGTEGANSIARSVLSQGAGSVIGTLWRIPDRPTSEFMKWFYLYLKQRNGDASKALAQTKRNFIKSGRFKHPYFWGGFVLTSTNQVYDSNVFR